MLFIQYHQLRKVIIDNYQKGRCVSQYNFKSNPTSSQTKKIYIPNQNKFKPSNRNEKILNPKDFQVEKRVNDFGIQMLAEALHKQIFLDKNEKVLVETINKSKTILQKHGMLSINSEEEIPNVNFKIPKLYGNSLLEHFNIIGEEQAKPYRNLIQNLLEDIPKAPEQWLMHAGWIRYTHNQQPQPVDYPPEDAIVFDIEVCVESGKAPTLATAVSKDAWYGWVSQSLLDGRNKPISNEYLTEVLIPLESSSNEHGYQNLPKFHTPKVVIGHNVSYDRARIKEQYWLERTATRFVDTMSLHICVSGLTSYQRAILNSSKENVDDYEWKTKSSLNNLNDVHKLYCGTEIPKETREIFMKGNLNDVKKQFQIAMTYCSKDVQATYNVLKRLFPLFLERFPHPVTFAGMLELSTAYLPINSNWRKYIEDSQQAYDDLAIEGQLILSRSADQRCQLLHNNEYKNDIWMWDEAWEIKHIKLKSLPKLNSKNIKDQNENCSECEDEEKMLLNRKFDYLEKIKTLLPAVRPLLPGYPNWYRKLCSKSDFSSDWVPHPHLISTAMQITPKLLGLTWEGYPLYFIRGKGWGFLVPYKCDANVKVGLPLKQLVEKCSLSKQKISTNSNLDMKIDKEIEMALSKKEYYRLKKNKGDVLYKGSGVWCDTVIDDCCWFFKLPHKDGASHRVGNPLAKDFLNKFSESVLAGDTESAETVLSITKMLSYWKNNRDRILDQMVVWLEDYDLPDHLHGHKYGAILPQVIVCGTLTRRAVEPTWMTASNAYSERIGSELRSMVQAPPGYNIIGADVDSQELWIAAIIGDADFANMHGATPFGWMTLSGNKTTGTDMHSITAKAIGISREHAKVINYARIYGAGQSFAERLLKQFNPTLSDNEAKNKALKMFELTKGKRVYFLKKEYLTEFPNKPYSQWQAHELAKIHRKTVNDIFEKSKWIGGIESAMFNRLEEIANESEPKTPFLNCRLSRALESNSVLNNRFLPTKVNWVVQSGAVDFLHLMLVSMRWIMGNRARFCLSFHDEIRYLVPADFKYQAALALHVTNLLTRSFCAIKLGLNDLPQSVAFFSSVEVDTVLRKESQHDCKTPSNPHGLSKGYGIPHGESLNIYEAVEKANGQCNWWSSMK